MSFDQWLLWGLGIFVALQTAFFLILLVYRTKNNNYKLDQVNNWAKNRSKTEQADISFIHDKLRLLGNSVGRTLIHHPEQVEHKGHKTIVTEEYFEYLKIPVPRIKKK